jgi:DNA mismatch endonuclease (patch repair protein)
VALKHRVLYSNEANEMADVVDKETRSRMMSGIRGKNTKPERLLRTALHLAGFRYRVHGNKLPGKPDLVFPKYKAVVFVHGCFWHRHPGCWWSTSPSSNVEFWLAKFGQNTERDARNVADLVELGWRVAVVWECSLRLQSKEVVAASLGEWLKSQDSSLTLPKKPRKRLKPPSK